MPNQDESTSELLTTRQVAELLQVSSQRVRQLVRDRDDFHEPALASATPRGIGTRKWRREDVERWREQADRRPGRRY